MGIYEETLTIHSLGLREELGKSFCTTNIIKNINSQLKSIKQINRNIKLFLYNFKESAGATFKIRYQKPEIPNY
jgi:hypothetical protein